MCDHWLIQRRLVDAIVEPTPSATIRLQAEDILTNDLVLPLQSACNAEKLAGVLLMQALSAHWKLALPT